MGSVSESLTSSGTIASHSLYDAYGNKLNSGSQSPFGFGGQSGYQTDTETDLLLLTHRYYDPAEGRFLTRDPIGYAGGINLYAYCGNNPVERLDPSGLYWNADDWGNFRDSMHWVKPVCVDGADALLQGNAEFWSGMGDHISLGATKYVRAQFGRDDYASSKSGLHKAGLYARIVTDIALNVAIASPVSPLFQAGSKIRVPGLLNGRLKIIGDRLRFGYTWDETSKCLKFGFHGGVPRTPSHWHYTLTVPKHIHKFFRTIQPYLEYKLW